jgi:hypothetical protein
MSARLTFVSSDPILTRGLRGRSWFFGGLLGLIAGLGIYFQTPPAYTATSVVELASLSPVIDLSPTAAKAQPFTIDSDAQLVADGQVVSAIAAATGQQPSTVRRSLSVSARQVTRILQITYTASTPESATAGAQQAAEALLDERKRLLVQPVQDYLTDVLVKTESPQKSLSLTQSTTLLTADLSSRAQSRVEGLRDRAIAAQLQSKGEGSVLERARVRVGADRGDVEVPVVTGACLGALLGVCVGVARGHVKQARLLTRARAAAAAVAETVTS